VNLVDIVKNPDNTVLLQHIVPWQANIVRQKRRYLI